jgi:hypothetical protein
VTNDNYTIALTADEQELLDKITFEVRMSTPHEERLENFDRAGDLTERLLKRDAIPQHRLDWFTEPEYNISGRGSSREQIFRRNAAPDTDIFRHPHFLRYLRYCIFGPDLPARLMSDFQDEVAACGSITSGDILPLASLARQQVRTHRLDAKRTSEEYFKLALEVGLDAEQARTIRDHVRKVR